MNVNSWFQGKFLGKIFCIMMMFVPMWGMTDELDLDDDIKGLFATKRSELSKDQSPAKSINDYMLLASKWGADYSALCLDVLKRNQYGGRVVSLFAKEGSFKYGDQFLIRYLPLEENIYFYVFYVQDGKTMKLFPQDNKKTMYSKNPTRKNLEYIMSENEQWKSINVNEKASLYLFASSLQAIPDLQPNIVDVGQLKRLLEQYGGKLLLTKVEDQITMTGKTLGQFQINPSLLLFNKTYAEKINLF